MYRLTLYLRAALLGLLLIGFPTYDSSAQALVKRRANQLVSSINTSDDGKAYDDLDNTAATLAPPALAGISRLRLRFPFTVPQNGKTGLVVNTGGALAAGVLGYVVIRTYMGTSMKEDFPLSNLLALNVVNNTIRTAEFFAQEPFNEIEMEIGGVLNLGTTAQLYSTYAFVAPLPVELAVFQGKATSAGTALTWKTVSEHNNDHFVVERRQGAQADFQAIGQVQGAGNSSQAHQYQFVDASPALVSYYRLRQVDYDGQTAFSPVVVVQSNSLSGSLTAYPSPTAETLTVTGPAGTHLSIFDQLGRQVQATDISLAQQQVLDVHELPNGVYFLRDAATGKSTKFINQR